MKKTVRLLAAFLCILITAGLLPLSAFAAERTPSGMIDLYSGSASFYASHRDAMEALYKGFMNHEEAIEIYSYNIPASSAKELYNAVRHTYPELFFMSLSYSYNMDSNRIIYQFKPDYLKSKTEADSMLREFYAKADTYLNMLDGSMDDFTKAVVLHDKLVADCRYQITSSSGEGSSAYTFMVKGWGKCEDYSECYAYLLARAGIKSEIIISSSMQHEWMKINLGGSDYYYNVDMTWDDPLINNADAPGKAYHHYFLFSDSKFNELNHYDYPYIHGSDSAYDSFDKLHSLDNPLFYINGELYTLYSSGSKGYIATYDHFTDSFTDKVVIDDIWHWGSYGRWNGNFSGIGEYDGLLYYNGENCVYVYDPVTGVKSVYSDNVLSDGNQLYGLYVKNGRLIGLAAPDPNSAAVETDLGECVRSYSVEVNDGILHGSVVPDKRSAKAGDTVTLTVTPDDGFTVSAVRCDNTLVYPVNGRYSFVMPSYDVHISAEFGYADGIGARLAGNTVSLEGDIGVNFYMELSDSVIAHETSAYMLFTCPGSKSSAELRVPVKDAVHKELNGRTYYVFKCNVAAREMTEEIRARIVDGNNLGTEYVYSVAEYADYLLENAFDRYGNVKNRDYAAAAPLVRAMLNYGAASQEFFGSASIPANSVLSDVERRLSEVPQNALANYASYGSALDNSVILDGATLSLYSETTLSLYFISEKKLSFSCSDKTVETEASGEYQIARIRGIASMELADSFSVSVSDGAGNDLGTVVYSPMNYCFNVLDDDSYSSGLRNTVTALYWYCAEAYGYFR